jgi:hypothetical protein
VVPLDKNVQSFTSVRCQHCQRTIQVMGTPKLKCFGIELQVTDHQVLINHLTFNIWGVWMSSFHYLMLIFFLIFQCKKTVTSLNA